MFRSGRKKTETADRNETKHVVSEAFSSRFREILRQEGETIFENGTTVENGTIRTSTGRLAGSASDLYRDVTKAIEFGIPREEAFYLASTAPATYMGLNKGRIEVGYDADFIAVDEKNELHTVVIGGEIFKT